MSTGPLAGRTVVVTRPKDQAGPLNQLLRSAGAVVIEFPLIGTVPPADGGAELQILVSCIDQYDWLVVTSPNGAQAVRSAAGEIPAPQVRIAAVGRATAAAIGWPVELVPVGQDSEALAKVFPRGRGNVLLVQGDRAPTMLADRLRGLGWKVDRVVGYRTQAVEPDPGLIAAVVAADVITFASGSAVRSFVEQLGLVAMPPIVVTLGSATVNIAQECGVVVTASAESNTIADLGLAVVVACSRATPGSLSDEATFDPS